ncbi:hypothetical protein Bca101_056056 [Brassica carinata]
MKNWEKAASCKSRLLAMSERKHNRAMLALQKATETFNMVTLLCFETSVLLSSVQDFDHFLALY